MYFSYIAVLKKGMIYMYGKNKEEKKIFIGFLLKQGYTEEEAKKLYAKGKEAVKVQEKKAKEEEKKQKVQKIRTDYHQFLVEQFAKGLNVYDVYTEVLRSDFLLTTEVPDFKKFKKYVQKNGLYVKRTGDTSKLLPYEKEIREKLAEEGQTAWSVYNYMIGKYGPEIAGNYGTFRGWVRKSGLRPDRHNPRFYTQHSRSKRVNLDSYRNEIRKELAKVDNNMTKAHANLTEKYGKKNIGSYMTFASYVRTYDLRSKGNNLPDTLYFHRGEIRRVLQKFNCDVVKAYNVLSKKIDAELIGSLEDFEKFVEKHKLQHSEAEGHLLKEREVRQEIVKTLQSGNKVHMSRFKEDFGVGYEISKKCYQQVLEGFTDLDITPENDFLHLHMNEIAKEFRTGGKYTSYTHVYHFLCGKYGADKVGDYFKFVNFVKSNNLKVKVSI